MDAARRITTRKREDTSWLAQSITDMMEIEHAQNGDSSRLHCLATVRYTVQCADDNNNGWGIVYGNDQATGERLITIPSIPYGMQPDYLGLAECSKDAEGQYTVHALVTHGLNSAVINVSRLMAAMRGVA
jgi:hypothetical protein